VDGQHDHGMVRPELPLRAYPGRAATTRLARRPARLVPSARIQ
jgi:hypothetical protein